MKNIAKLIGVIALMAVIGFSFAALSLTGCDNDDDGGTTYTVTVNGGNGSGSYAAGATVSITATPPAGQTFANWTVSSGGATLVNANSASTTFTMPANAVTVTANFTGGNNIGGPATYVSTDSNGNKYTLEIDESGAARSARSAARSAAQAGDTFKLTVEYSVGLGGGDFKMTFEYSGTVGAANASGASVSLTLDINGETITITIVGTQMTVITGRIVNDSGQEVVNNPGNVTPESVPGGVPVTGVALNKTQLALTVGAQETLTATVAPSNAANKSVTWSSNNTSVATVSYGTVIGVSAGTATITVATVDGNKTASCTVTVGGGDGGNTFTSITAFDTWLGSQPVNTAASAYNVSINVSNLGGAYNTSGSLGYVLYKSANANKYVNINLSGSTINSIPNSAFESRSTLADVTIGGSVLSIGASAFKGCTGLASVTIPNSVTSIGASAFNGCTSLTSVTIGSGVTSIGTNAFDGCTSLTSVTIPNNVTSIGAYAFQNCTVLGSVTFTATSKVASIGGRAFQGCTLLGSVTIPNSVTDIGGWAFEGCTNLSSVTIGSGVATFSGDGVFMGCTNLTSVTFLGTIQDNHTAWPDYGSSFPTYNTFAGDLRAKYFATTGGGPGTYTRAGTVWTKQ